MINNRQNGNGNGRRRGRAGGTPRPNGSGGGADRGSRLDNRARGNASQLHEKYKTLAADAQRQGDRVMTEYYLQFADHYFRVLSETRSRFDEQQQPRPARFDGQSEDFDEGEGETGGDDRFDDRTVERGQQWTQERGDNDGNRENYRDRNAGQPSRNDGARADGNRNDGNRGEGNRADGNREGARGLEGPRADAGRERPEQRSDRGDEQREYRQAREPRQPRDQTEQRPRDQGEQRQFREQGDRQQGEQRAPREQSDGRERQPREQADGREPRQPRLLRRERPEEQARTQAEPIAAPTEASPVLDAPVAETAELPLEAPVVEQRRPRGRPRKVVAPVEDDGERIEMDRLPPAFAPEPSAPVSADDGEEPKPRRTRRPRGETAAV
ncbi:DUF4167 domain-containing protein [Sphingomonas solaris]|uniref:DUF4167 domain-containing protein n=1 Tax=Alterirhizorhabdus solaris TaxID=2529389 RepID=A0A558QYV4_9SPHN|nr:DUF4167 domain-containing protein [Sphingomonas solaris]TVV72288.1 DUF4167 domain-containing protein [Sphingomonas solaris]